MNIDFSTFWINAHLDQIKEFTDHAKSEGAPCKSVYNSLLPQEASWDDVKCLMLAQLMIEELDSEQVKENTQG